MKLPLPLHEKALRRHIPTIQPSQLDFTASPVDALASAVATIADPAVFCAFALSVGKVNNLIGVGPGPGSGGAKNVAALLWKNAK